MITGSRPTHTLATPGEQAFARLAGERLLLLLDVDGTLAPIAPRPAEAEVPPETLDVLRALAAVAQVVFVSGRAAADARRMTPVAGTWVIGNHGFETISPTGVERPDPAVLPFLTALREAASRAQALARGTHGAIVEDKRWTLSVHYRLADSDAVPALAAGLDSIAAQLGLRITAGKEVIEIRPPLDIHKGTAVLRLARELGLDDAVRVLCAGDDRTDEDMFGAVRAAWPDALTVRVGADAVETRAEFAVPDPAALRELLAKLPGSGAR